MAVVTIVMLIVVFFTTVSAAVMAFLAVPSAAAAVPFPRWGLGSFLVPLLAIRDAQGVRQVQGIGKPLGHEC